MEAVDGPKAKIAHEANEIFTKNSNGGWLGRDGVDVLSFGGAAARAAFHWGGNERISFILNRGGFHSKPFSIGLLGTSISKFR